MAPVLAHLISTLAVTGVVFLVLGVAVSLRVLEMLEGE